MVLDVSKVLIDWYHANKRELPWRQTADPYCIWISEIILQQTRVNQGLEYYLRFLDKFPTVIDLAQADEGDVLKAWQGLGYYSRARNIHKASHQIVHDFGAVFPKSHREILSLKGIGDYTAAAIASFAYNLPFSVVDGNVYRFLSRLFAIETPIDTATGKKEFAILAQALMSKIHPGLHNQAIMEFGALQCTPISPNCSICPFNSFCCAFQYNKVSNLPLKSKKTLVSQRFFNYLFIEYQGNTFLRKRVEKDVWQNLYEFPLIESDHLLSVSELFENQQFCQIFYGVNELSINNVSKPMKHVLTHRVIFAQFFSMEVPTLNPALVELELVPFELIDKFAVSRLMELFIEKMNLNLASTPKSDF
jgi:A/G-specific adenine glycosylase